VKNVCRRDEQSGQRAETGRACPAVTRAGGVAWRRTYDPFNRKTARPTCLLIRPDLPSRLSRAKSSRATDGSRETCSNRKIWLWESAPIYGKQPVSNRKWIAFTALQHARNCAELTQIAPCGNRESRSPLASSPQSCRTERLISTPESMACIFRMVKTDDPARIGVPLVPSQDDGSERSESWGFLCEWKSRWRTS